MAFDDGKEIIVQNGTVNRKAAVEEEEGQVVVVVLIKISTVKNEIGVGCRKEGRRRGQQH